MISEVSSYQFFQIKCDFPLMYWSFQSPLLNAQIKYTLEERLVIFITRLICQYLTSWWNSGVADNKTMSTILHFVCLQENEQQLYHSSHNKLRVGGHIYHLQSPRWTW